MKKILSLLLLLSAAACLKSDLIDTNHYYASHDIFKSGGGVLTDATIIEIDIKTPGEYIISLEDEFTSKVITKEIFFGTKGANVLNVFTKIVPKGSYYLKLTDKNGSQIQKTKINL